MIAHAAWLVFVAWPSPLPSVTSESTQTPGPELRRVQHRVLEEIEIPQPVLAPPLVRHNDELNVTILALGYDSTRKQLASMSFAPPPASPRHVTPFHPPFPVPGDTPPPPPSHSPRRGGRRD